MAKKINLRGVIVPSSYDGEWAAKYIENGLFTPESNFRKQLAAAGADDLELYINSPGGSVFAGSEMTNALREHVATHGKSLTITVGALAASAAANLLITAPAAKIRMHSNGKLMFHSAISVTEGGPGAHADEMDILNKINGEIKAKLTTAYKLSPEQVATWFSEGRMGWLTAEEAKAAGIVDEIIADSAPRMAPKRAELKMMADRGLAIAALAVEPEMSLEAQALEDEIAERVSAIVGEKVAQAVAGAEANKSSAEELLAESAKAQQLAEQAAAAAVAKADAAEARAQAALVAQAEADKAKAEALEKLAAAESAKAEADKARAAAEAEADKQKKAVARLTAGFAVPGGAGAAPENFEQAVLKIEAEKKCSRGDAYTQAASQFPELLAASKIKIRG